MYTMPVLGAAPMPIGFKYSAVFQRGRPQHQKFDDFWRRHPTMDYGHRAKIFSPFDALDGFDERIRNKEKQYVCRVELDTDELRQLNRKLEILHNLTFNGRMARKNAVRVTITYFTPCSDTENLAFLANQGTYSDVTGIVQKVDEVHETVTIQTETGNVYIAFEDISDISAADPNLFDKDAFDDCEGWIEF